MARTKKTEAKELKSKLTLLLLYQVVVAVARREHPVKLQPFYENNANLEM